MDNTISKNMEAFYDCVDESCNYLYEIYHKPYFELIEMTAKNIMEARVTQDLEEEDMKNLQAIYDKIEGINFSVEDVRKAMQAIVLKGFKEMNISNWNTTPDTLGIFMSYFITKFFDEKTKLNILDPVCGTGNLLLTISNYLKNDVNLFACDNDLWMTKLTVILADLLNQPVEMYLQDTLNLNLNNMDVIAFDLPKSEYKDNKYLPYSWLLKYNKMLKDGGVMIGIVENDFFNYDYDKKFKEELLSTSTIVGIIELPDSMFLKIKPKCMVILEKNVVKDRKCFMIKLPSFDDAYEFNNSLRIIEDWFNKNYKKKEEN